MDHTLAADAYGESFADVYDEWYPSAPRAEAVVAALEPLRSPRHTGRADGRVLELGVGTGVLAAALAHAGWEVVGIDSSAAMLAAFEAKGGTEGVTTVLADASAPETWPAGPFAVVLAAWNLVTNLVDRDAQQRLLEGAARVLGVDGRLVVEAFVPLPPARRERRVAVGAAGPEVRVHTDADPATGVIEGRHIELRDGSVVVRPWRICWLGVTELDRMAASHGLELEARHEGWEGQPFVADESATHVSWYRLRPA